MSYLHWTIFQMEPTDEAKGLCCCWNTALFTPAATTRQKVELRWRQPFSLLARSHYVIQAILLLSEATLAHASDPFMVSVFTFIQSVSLFNTLIPYRITCLPERNHHTDCLVMSFFKQAASSYSFFLQRAKPLQKQSQYVSMGTSSTNYPILYQLPVSGSYHPKRSQSSWFLS